MDYSRSERIALAVLVSVGGVLSIIGSSLIIYMEMMRKEGPTRSPRRPTYHRFLLAMSFYKISQAIWASIGIAAVPKWSGGYGAIGNTRTCSAQGFFTTMSLAELIYNAGLSVYYVAVIRYGMKDQMVAHRLEPIVHVLAFVEPVSLGIIGLSMTIYNPPFLPELGCWASPKPLSCYFTHDTCERGRYFSQWSWTFYSQQCLYVAIVVIMSAVLYYTISTRYRAQNRYASRESLQMQQRSREVAFQALLFAAVCLYTNMWSIIVTLNYLFGANSLWNKIAVFNGAPAFTSQGFLNFLVYIRPRYVRLRRRKSDLGRWGSLLEVIFGDVSHARASFSSGSELSGSSRKIGMLSNLFRRNSGAKLEIRTTLSSTQANEVGFQSSRHPPTPNEIKDEVINESTLKGVVASPDVSADSAEVETKAESHDRSPLDGAN